MISYDPLKDYIYKHHLKLTAVVLKCGLNKSIVTKINQDRNIEIYSLAKICKELGIGFDQAVEIRGD